MCIRSVVVASLTRGTLQGLAGMRVRPLDSIKLSELVDRMNMIQFVIADVLARCVTC